MQRIRPRPSGDPGRAGVLPRRQIVGTLVLGLLLAVSTAGGLWTIHERSRTALDEEMGRRLVLIAEEIAATAVPESLLQWVYQDSTELALNTAPLRARIETIAERRGLNYVVLYSFEGDVLIDTSGLRELRRPDVYLFGDEELVALGPGPAHTPTREVTGGLFLKSAYAPVPDPVLPELAAPLGHVAVHAAPSFFETLRAMQRTLLGVGVGVLVLLVSSIGLYLFFAQRLTRAHAALQRTETLSAMGRMAAGIAHEIRNPLSIIKNSAQLLREELADVGVENDLVESIPEEVDRLNETLTAYLEFARDAPMRMEDVDLPRLVRRTLRLAERELEQAGVVVEAQLDGARSPELRADPRRLQQVLLNLVLNAIQAMPGGGELRVEVRDDRGEVRLVVADTGHGMDPADAQQIFEPFVTGREKGSGLGLYVVRRIVEDHGGRLELETAPERGTTFHVVLPRRGREE